MQGLEQFPPWVQITGSVLLFALTYGLHLLGRFSKMPRGSTDVAIPSVTIANAQVIERLAASVELSNKLAAEATQKDMEMRFELKRLADHVVEVRQQVYRLADQASDRIRERENDRSRQRSRERN